MGLIAFFELWAIPFVKGHRYIGWAFFWPKGPLIILDLDFGPLGWVWSLGFTFD